MSSNQIQFVLSTDTSRIMQAFESIQQKIAAIGESVDFTPSQGIGSETSIELSTVADQAEQASQALDELSTSLNRVDEINQSTADSISKVGAAAKGSSNNYVEAVEKFNKIGASIGLIGTLVSQATEGLRNADGSANDLAKSTTAVADGMSKAGITFAGVASSATLLGISLGPIGLGITAIVAAAAGLATVANHFDVFGREASKARQEMREFEKEMRNVRNTYQTFLTGALSGTTIPLIDIDIEKAKDRIKQWEDIRDQFLARGEQPGEDTLRNLNDAEKEYQQLLIDRHNLLEGLANDSKSYLSQSKTEAERLKDEISELEKTLSGLGSDPRNKQIRIAVEQQLAAMRIDLEEKIAEEAAIKAKESADLQIEESKRLSKAKMDEEDLLSKHRIELIKATNNYDEQQVEALVEKQSKEYQLFVDQKAIMDQQAADNLVLINKKANKEIQDHEFELSKASIDMAAEDRINALQNAFSEEEARLNNIINQNKEQQKIGDSRIGQTESLIGMYDRIQNALSSGSEEDKAAAAINEASRRESAEMKEQNKVFEAAAEKIVAAINKQDNTMILG